MPEKINNPQFIRGSYDSGEATKFSLMRSTSDSIKSLIGMPPPEVLCIYDPSQNSHVATGATRTDLEILTSHTKKNAPTNEQVNAALKILKSFGLDFGDFPDLRTLVNCAQDLASGNSQLSDVRDLVELHRFAQHQHHKLNIKKAGLIDSTRATNTYNAKHIATSLIDRFTGEIDIKKLKQLKYEIENSPSTPHKSFTLSLISKLGKNENNILTELLKIQAPPQKGPVAEIIRSTLGLSPQTQLTQAHSRQTVLCTLFTETRQDPLVGSCFATSLNIFVQKNNPERMIKELGSLVEHGHIEIKDGNKIKKVPLNSSSSPAPLKQRLFFDDNLNLIQIDRNALEEPVALSQSPSIQAGLNALNIPQKSHPDVLNFAIMLLRNTDQPISVEKYFFRNHCYSRNFKRRPNPFK